MRFRPCKYSFSLRRSKANCLECEHLLRASLEVVYLVESFLAFLHLEYHFYETGRGDPTPAVLRDETRLWDRVGMLSKAAGHLDPFSLSMSQQWLQTMDMYCLICEVAREQCSPRKERHCSCDVSGAHE